MKISDILKENQSNAGPHVTIEYQESVFADRFSDGHRYDRPGRTAELAFRSSPEPRKYVEMMVKMFAKERADQINVGELELYEIEESQVQFYVSISGPATYVLDYLKARGFLEDLLYDGSLESVFNETSKDYYYVMPIGSSKTRIHVSDYYSAGMLKFLRIENADEVTLFSMPPEEPEHNHGLLKACEIVTNHLNGSKDPIQCKKDLISAGLKQFAKM